MWNRGQITVLTLVQKIFHDLALFYDPIYRGVCDTRKTSRSTMFVLGPRVGRMPEHEGKCRDP